jgi:hypothetical protein
MQQGVNQAMAGPLIDRNGAYVHYEVRHNKPYYDTVKDHKYYLRTELDKHRWPRKMLQLPISNPDHKAYGALEVKAAWRALDPTEDEATANRYYWTWARVPDPKTGKCGPRQRVALVGLHVIQKVKGFNSWLWATFEHVDNVPCNYSDNSKCPPVPSHYSFNAKDKALDDAAKANRGYAPRSWKKPPVDASGRKVTAKWKPIDPKYLPPEPIGVDDRINAVRMLPVRSSADARNAEFHALPGIAGTFWENYILIDTQWPGNGGAPVVPPDLAKTPTDAEYVRGALDPDPGLGVPVANITMETFYQKKNPSLSSLGETCMQCHYAAAQTDFSWTLTNRAWPPHRATKE